MFMKAILHNKEDDLHFLLKCLVEELEDGFLLKQEDTTLEDEIFSEDSIQDMVEQDAIEESDFKNIKEEDFIGEGKDAKQVKAKVMNKLTSGFYADVKRAIEAEQKKSPTPLTRQQREKIAFDLREKTYKKFISEGKPLEIKGKDFEYKWSVDEIKDTWKEYTADRDNELRRQQYVKDTTELKYRKNLLNSFIVKKPIPLPMTLLTSKIYEREVKRGMTKRHPKGTKEYKIIQDYFDALYVEDEKIGLAQLEKPKVAEIKDKTKRAKKIKEIEKIIEDATEEKKKLHAGIDEKLPKDAEGNPIWVAEFKLTDEEKKEYQDRIKELETKTQKDEKFFKELQRSSKKVSPIQVMQADGELAGQAKELKNLLEQQAVKDYLQDKKNPLEDKVLTAYMKGSYSEDKLKEFLQTDAKGGGEPKLSSRDKAGGKRIPLGDGKSLKTEAYRRIYNYLELLTEKIKETTKSGNLKRKLGQIQDKMKEHNTKMFADLDTTKTTRVKKYTTAAYRTLFESLKEMKEISNRKDTSDNKRMLYAKKVFEGDTGKKNVVINKYGMTLMRDLMNIAMGQKLEKPPKKQRKDSKRRSQQSAITRKIKTLRQKISESDKEFKAIEEKLKGKGLNDEETTKYLDFKKDREDLADKVKELTTKLSGKVSGARKDGGSVEGTPASLRQQKKERERKRGKLPPPKEREELSEYEKFRREVEYGVSTVKRRAVKENPKFVERYLKENPDDKEYIGELKKAEEPFGEKTGLNAFRFFDVDMIQNKYVLTEREAPLSSKDKNYAQIEKFANDIKDILSDEKIMSAIEKTYSKLTGGVVFGQDKESADKRKEVSEALASLKPFISERRRIKKLLKPIPDFLVKEMIADEEKLSKNLLLLLKTLERIQIVDVSNILVDNNKLVSDKNKIKGIGGSPYYNIFNKPIAVLKIDSFSIVEGDKKLQDEFIQATKDEYSENSNSFLRDYWNVVIERLKKDIQDIGEVEEDEKGRKKVFMYDLSISELTENTEKYYKTISNPTSRKKKAFDEFFLALDEKQDGKAFFREVEDLVKSIIKLQKTYRTKKSKTSEPNLNEIAREYSIETIRRMDKAIDDKEITEPSQDALSEEDSEKETKRITAQLKPLQDKLKEMRKDDEADEEELSNLIQEIKTLKRTIDELKAEQTVKTTFGNKTYRFTSPIPISVDDGKKIIMGALEPLAGQKRVDSVEELFETDIDDSILIQALEKQFLNYFKKNKEVKEIIVEGKEIYDFQTAMLEQIEDDFKDLIKTFKSKNNVVDMSKVKINMDGSKLKELLVEETIGEELAKILDNDLTDIYDSYVKNLTKVKERHEQNMKNAEKISQSFAPKTKERAKREEEQIQTIPKEKGDEEE